MSNILLETKRKDAYMIGVCVCVAVCPFIRN